MSSSLSDLFVRLQAGDFLFELVDDLLFPLIGSSVPGVSYGSVTRDQKDRSGHANHQDALLDPTASAEPV